MGSHGSIYTVKKKRAGTYFLKGDGRKQWDQTGEELRWRGWSVRRPLP